MEGKGPNIRWTRYKYTRETGARPSENNSKQQRVYFKLLFQYVIWFATNEIAFRGHDEAADSKNPGNWTTFIKIQLKTNKEFRSLHQAITDKTLLVDYTSKTSLNEMLSILAVSYGTRYAIRSQLPGASVH